MDPDIAAILGEVDDLDCSSVASSSTASKCSSDGLAASHSLPTPIEPATGGHASPPDQRGSSPPQQEHQQAQQQLEEEQKDQEQQPQLQEEQREEEQQQHFQEEQKDQQEQEQQHQQQHEQHDQQLGQQEQEREQQRQGEQGEQPMQQVEEVHEEQHEWQPLKVEHHVHQEVAQKNAEGQPLQLQQLQEQPKQSEERQQEHQGREEKELQHEQRPENAVQEQKEHKERDQGGEDEQQLEEHQQPRYNAGSRSQQQLHHNGFTSHMWQAEDSDAASADHDFDNSREDVGQPELKPHPVEDDSVQHKALAREPEHLSRLRNVGWNDAYRKSNAVVTGGWQLQPSPGGAFDLHAPLQGLGGNGLLVESGLWIRQAEADDGFTHANASACDGGWQETSAGCQPAMESEQEGVDEEQRPGPLSVAGDPSVAATDDSANAEAPRSFSTPVGVRFLEPSPSGLEEASFEADNDSSVDHDFDNADDEPASRTEEVSAVSNGSPESVAVASTQEPEHASTSSAPESKELERPNRLRVSRDMHSYGHTYTMGKWRLQPAPPRGVEGLAAASRLLLPEEPSLAVSGPPARPELRSSSKTGSAKSHEPASEAVGIRHRQPRQNVVSDAPMAPEDLHKRQSRDASGDAANALTVPLESGVPATSLTQARPTSQVVVEQPPAQKQNRRRRRSSRPRRASKDDPGGSEQPEEGHGQVSMQTRPIKASPLSSTVTFRPGCLGLLADWESGVVASVVNGGQAASHGVKKGWRFKEVDGKPYAADVLDACVIGNRQYVVSFQPQEVGSDQAIRSSCSQKMRSLAFVKLAGTHRKVMEMRQQLSALSVCCDDLERMVKKGEQQMAGLVRTHADAMEQAASQLNALPKTLPSDKVNDTSAQAFQRMHEMIAGIVGPDAAAKQQLEPALDAIS